MVKIISAHFKDNPFKALYRKFLVFDFFTRAAIIFFILVAIATPVIIKNYQSLTSRAGQPPVIETDWSNNNFESKNGIDPDNSPGQLFLQNDSSNMVSAFSVPKNVYDMVVYKDKLIISNATSLFMSSDAFVHSYDYQTNSVNQIYSYADGFKEQGIDRMFVFNDKLYIPGPDRNDGGWDLGAIYIYDGANWTRKLTVPKDVHGYTLAPYKNDLYFLFAQASGSATATKVYKSSDDGDTWSPADNNINDPRGMLVYNDKLAVFGYGDYLWTYDGSAGQNIQNFPAAVSLTGHAEFGGKLYWAMTYPPGPLGLFSTSDLTNFDTVDYFKTKEIIDLAVYDSKLYAITSEGKMHYSSDGSAWNSFAQNLPKQAGFPSRLQQYHGRLYFGGAGGAVYVSSAIASGDLVSKPIGLEIGNATISWDGFTPDGTALKFQVKSAKTEAELAAKTFIGPDGTEGSYYETSGATLNSIHNGDSWLQYKVFMTTADSRLTPYINSITLTSVPAPTPTLAPTSTPVSTSSAFPGWDKINTIYYNPAQDDAANKYLEQTANELKDHLAKAGKTITIATTVADATAINLKVDSSLSVRDEAFKLNSDSGGVYITGKTPLAVRHGAYTFLEKLGFRWFYKHPIWTVSPKTLISLDLNEVQEPFFTLREISILNSINPGDDYSAYTASNAEIFSWLKRNKGYGAVFMPVYHSYAEIIDRTEYNTHPEWFLPEGRYPSYPWQLRTDNADVVARAITFARNFLNQGAKGSSVGILPVGAVPISPNDGGGWNPPWSLADTQLITDKVFYLANEVAKAIKSEFPGKYVSLYMYGRNVEIPSFSLEPNIMVQIATNYNYGSLSLPQQISGMKAKGVAVGIRDYLGVWNWSKDSPAMNLNGIKQLAWYASQGIKIYKTESHDGWGGGTGLTNYLVSKLLWNPNLNVDTLLDDFYTKAFGPAKVPMKKYFENRDTSKEALKITFEALDEAERLAAGDNEILERIRYQEYHNRYVWFWKNVGLTNLSLEKLKEFYTFNSRIRDLYVVLYRGVEPALRKELQIRGLSDIEINALKNLTLPTAAEARAWLNKGLAEFASVTITVPEIPSINPQKITLAALGDTTKPKLIPLNGMARQILVPSSGDEDITVMVKGSSGTIQWYGPTGLLLESYSVSSLADWTPVKFRADLAGNYIVHVTRAQPVGSSNVSVDIPNRPASLLADPGIKIFEPDEWLDMDAPVYQGKNEVYFYVPPGTGVFVFGTDITNNPDRHTTGRLVDPNNTEYAFDFGATSEKRFDSPAPGLWKIEISSTVMYRHFWLQGIPPLVWHDPKYLLISGSSSIVPTSSISLPTSVPSATKAPTPTSTPVPPTPTLTKAPTPTSTPVPPTPTRTPTPIPTPTPIACAVISGSWLGPSAVEEGTTVTLSIKTNNVASCEGKKIVIDIRKDNALFPDESATVNPQPIDASRKTVTTQWVAEFHPNGPLGLLGSPQYFFNAGIGGQAGVVRSSDPKLTVNKAKGLAISTTPQVSTSTNSATIVWETNLPSSTSVDYGITGRYGRSGAVNDKSAMGLVHFVEIPNLKACTAYHFQAVSEDESLNKAVSKSKFITAGCTASVIDDVGTDVSTDITIGGSIDLLNESSHGVSLKIPPAYSASSLLFQILQLNRNEFINNISSPVGLSSAGNYVYNLKAFKLDEETKVSKFDENMTVKVNYTPIDIENIDEDSLVIYRWDGKIWNALTGCILDKANKSVSCKTSSFSDFVLFGEPVLTPTPTPAPAALQSSSGDSGGGSGGGGGGGSGGSGGGGSTSGTDLNGDGKTNIFDLSIFLRNWNKSGAGDFNKDGKVNIFDLSILLRNWSR